MRLARTPVMFFGQRAAPCEAHRAPLPPVRTRRGRFEGAIALQPQLVYVNGPGEQTARQVDVGEDQVGSIHASQRGHLHHGVGRVGEDLFVYRRSVREAEDVGLCSDRERVFKDCVGKVNRGVPQLQGGRG
jgi:hypothetical protein